MHIAVIGGLAAGPAAAAEAVRAGAEVSLFEARPHVSVGACEIPYWIAGQVGGSLEVLTPDGLAASRGIGVFVNHRVLGLEPARGRLAVEATAFGSTREVRADRFILATGARARALGVPGEDARGVFSLRDAVDAQALRAWLESEPVRHVVVVGAGYVGVEIAEAMRARGVRATLLEPLGRALARTLHADLSAGLDAAIRAHGVALRPEVAVEVLADARGRVRAVRTDRGEIVGCQCVVVAVGVEPATELARGAGIALGPSGGVETDAQMRTSARGVWACGDCAEVRRVVDGRRLLWPLAPTARQTARVAARNAARAGRGAPEAFAGVTGAVGVRAFGVEAAGVGLTDEEAAETFDAVGVTVSHWSRVRRFPGARRLLVRLVVERGTGRLLGGQLVGAEGAVLRADVLVPLVRSGATARALAEDLDLIYNPPVAPAVDPLRVAAREADKAAREGTRTRPPAHRR